MIESVHALVFRGRVRDISVNVLKDGGSEACWVSEDLVRRLNWQHRVQPLSEKQWCAGAFGHQKLINGTINLLYHIGDRANSEPFNEYRNFAVMRGCAHDVILGMPFLKKHNPQFDYKGRSMTIKRTNDRGIHETLVFRAVTQRTPSPAIKLLDIKVLRCQVRNLAVRASTEGYWIYVYPKRGSDDDEYGPGNVSPRPAEVNVATISVVHPGDAGSVPMLGSPTGHTSVLHTTDKSEGAPSLSERLAAALAKHEGVFSEPTGVVPRPGFEHRIHLKEGATPPKAPMYRMTPKMLEETRKQLAEFLDKGHIRPSSSPFAAPILFVGKKDTTDMRMCVDYRRLNALTVKDAYPIPRIDQLIEVLHGASVFSKLDLAAAFNQIPVAEEDVDKTAFVTRYGQFEFRVLPFGLCNAPATCMRLMQGVLSDFLDDFVVVYLDDILIFSKTEDEHVRHVDLVLERLEQENFRLKRKKCVFGVNSVAYLGHVVSKDGLSMDPDKIKAILEWPAPKNVTELRSFLGLIGYYRKFLGNFGEVSAPLVELTKKEVRWEWDALQQSAFAALKELLTSAPTLLIPDTRDNNSFVIHIDASDYAVGAVLLQDQGKGLQPCAYYSKKLDAAQRNYSVGDKEMLAMKLALLEYKIYVEGLPTVMCTDHRNNADLLTRPLDAVASRRIARVIEFMQQFSPNLTLAYVKGEDNHADALSRRPDLQEEGALEEATLDPEWREKQFGYRQFDLPLPTAAIRCNVIRVQPRALERDIVAAYGHDSNYHRSRRSTNAFLRQVSRTDNEQVYRHKGRIAVPADDDIRRQILQLCHDEQAHLGENKTLAAVGMRFWWPQWRDDVRSYVKECATCQRAKSSTQKVFGRMLPISIPGRNGQILTMDVIGPVEPSNGSNAILVVVDKRSKWTIATPTSHQLNSRQLIQHLHDDVFPVLGWPEAIICDRGPYFISAEFRRFCERAGVDLRASTAYHAQTNGQTERHNRTIIDLLRATLLNNTARWYWELQKVVKAYNEAVNASTGFSPHFLLHGQHPRQEIDKAVPSGFPAGPSNMQDVNRQVAENLARASQQQAKQYDKHRRPIKYNVRDKVYVDAQYLPVNRMTKFSLRRAGPFEVVRVLNDNSYAVRVPGEYSNSMVDVRLSIDKLQPYRPSTQWHLDEGRVRRSQNRQVERILNHRQYEGRTRTYLCRFVGHHPGLDEWLPAAFIQPLAVLVAYKFRKGLTDGDVAGPPGKS